MAAPEVPSWVQVHVRLTRPHACNIPSRQTPPSSPLVDGEQEPPPLSRTTPASSSSASLTSLASSESAQQPSSSTNDGIERTRKLLQGLPFTSVLEPDELPLSVAERLLQQQVGMLQPPRSPTTGAAAARRHVFVSYGATSTGKTQLMASTIEQFVAQLRRWSGEAENQVTDVEVAVVCVAFKRCVNTKFRPSSSSGSAVHAASSLPLADTKRCGANIDKSTAEKSTPCKEELVDLLHNCQPAALRLSEEALSSFVTGEAPSPTPQLPASCYERFADFAALRTMVSDCTQRRTKAGVSGHVLYVFKIVPSNITVCFFDLCGYSRGTAELLSTENNGTEIINLSCGAERSGGASGVGIDGFRRAVHVSLSNLERTIISVGQAMGTAARQFQPSYFHYSSAAGNDGSSSAGKRGQLTSTRSSKRATRGATTATAVTTTATTVAAQQHVSFMGSLTTRLFKMCVGARLADCNLVFVLCVAVGTRHLSDAQSTVCFGQRALALRAAPSSDDNRKPKNSASTDRDAHQRRFDAMAVRIQRWWRFITAARRLAAKQTKAHTDLRRWEQSEWDVLMVRYRDGLADVKQRVAANGWMPKPPVSGDQGPRGRKSSASKVCRVDSSTQTQEAPSTDVATCVLWGDIPNAQQSKRVQCDMDAKELAQLRRQRDDLTKELARLTELMEARDTQGTWQYILEKNASQRARIAELEATMEQLRNEGTGGAFT